MSTPRPRLFVLALAALLAGCAFSDDTLMPALSGEDTAGGGAAHGEGSLPQSSPSVSVATTATAATTAAAASRPSSDKIAGLRADLQRLQGDIAQHTSELKEVKSQLDQVATTFDGLAGGIETRLKSTNVPNDPQLSSDFNQAQTQLNRAGEGLARLNNIASWGQSDGALASYILQAARAAESDPTTDAPERRQLAEIEYDTNHAVVSVDQLVTETSGEIANRNLYVAAAQRRLAALGPDIGAGVRTARSGPAPIGATASRSSVSTSPAPGATDGRRALVTIRFDRPDVAYEEQLYGAVKEALARRPDVAFDIVAVTPPGRAVNAEAQERNVASVVHSLSNMGLPADRFRLSSATVADASANEVRIYVR